MATSTIVLTYTAGSGAQKDVVTSMTVGGTAYGSLSAADVNDAIQRLFSAITCLQSSISNGTGLSAAAVTSLRNSGSKSKGN